MKQFWYNIFYRLEYMEYSDLVFVDGSPQMGVLTVINLRHSTFETGPTVVGQEQLQLKCPQ